jgi:hypothetical protein
MAKQKAQTLPRDAQKLLRDFDRNAQAVWDKAAAEVEKLRKELAAALKAAQDDHVRAGRFDEALMVREQINRLSATVGSGRLVEVESEGGWWEAEILQTRGNRYFVRYVGWDDSWNEWVGPNRVRVRGSTKQARRRSPARRGE